MPTTIILGVLPGAIKNGPAHRTRLGEDAHQDAGARLIDLHSPEQEFEAFHDLDLLQRSHRRPRRWIDP